MNYRRISLTLGTFAVFISLMLVFPALWALHYGEHETLPAFGAAALAGVLLGVLMRRMGRDAPAAIYRREGVVIVTGSWLIASLVGCLPYLFSGEIPRIEDAFFESMSGFTTTGSTILPEIGRLSRGILFWRSMTHWLGGMGIIVLFVAVLPALGVGARVLYHFEAPGVEGEQLRPRIRETAGTLWKVYAVFTAVEVLLLMAAGLDFYDGLVHTFGTVATGGFSIYDASIGHYSDPAAGIPVPALVDVIVIVFMFLAGVNFSLYWKAVKNGPGVVFRDPEFRTYALVLVGASVFVTVVLFMDGVYGGLGDSARKGFFQVVSITTTTGYGTADFDAWPQLLRLLMVCLMFMGGCAGSTGGGMKVFRLLLVFRFVGHEVLRFIRPHRVKSLVVGGQPVPDEVMRNTLAFFALAIVVWVAGSLFMAALGLELETAVSSVTACLWNIGPGLDAVGPTRHFAHLPGEGKVLLSFLMLVGRLEIYTALALLVPALYKD